MNVMGMKNLTNHIPNRKSTPQSQPIPGRESEMACNDAGGYVFTVTPWVQLSRFITIGTESGTYYASEQKHTEKNVQCVLECLKLDGVRVVNTVVEVSDAGRAPKNDPALFVLAMACKLGDDATKRAAYAALPKVARIGTHLFHWAEAIKTFGGFTSGFQRAVSRWYLDRDPRDLALQAVKYQSRDGWSHSDMLRLAKPGGGAGRRKALPDSEQAHILGWITDRWMPDLTAAAPSDATALIWAHEQAKAIGLTDVTKDGTTRIVSLITDYRLPRECIPTAYLNEMAIWDALLDNGGRGMPLEALIRNLPKMTAVGLLSASSDAVKKVLTALGNDDAIRKARIHPLKVLMAMKIYGSGTGVRGSLTWTHIPRIVDALDGAFYKAFQAVEPSGKRHLLALDVSGSMGAGIAGMPGIDCRMASAAMAMVTAAVEPETHIVGFTNGGYSARKSQWAGYMSGITELDISPRRRLDDNVRTIANLPFGGTDCALPMIYAKERKLQIDVFVVYTDSETWHSPTHHPVQALNEYRQASGIPARMAVVAMTSTGFSIADPKDSGTMDFVGMDTTVPALLADFARGNV